MLEWNYKGKKGVINSYVLCSVLEDMVIMSSKKKRFYGWVTVILIVVGTVLSLRVSFMSQAVGLLTVLDYNGYCYDSEKFILGFGVSELRSVVSQDELERLVEKKLKGDFEKKSRDRAIRYFIYRGYEASDIIETIERLMTDEF